ncbi:MAG: arginine--tRNA ligase [Candidatus Eisenbacteria bacterium]|nr:arginine--tRNA ligase [Candidatus Eisenbacteria bacterium]
MISSYLTEAVRSAVAAAGLGDPGPVLLETPKDRAHGDLATNVAMQLASKGRAAGKGNPRAVAEAVVTELRARLDPALIAGVSIAGPGFINFAYHPDVVRRSLAEILEAGAGFGRSDWGAGEKVLLEFVSANPTGPLNVVSARAASVGDSLARLFRACGFEARTEYYVNDAGNQVRKLGESLLARIREAGGEALVIPENGYHGEYLKEMAQAMGPEARAEMLARADAAEACTRYALTRILAGQQADLESFGVRFDRFFHETELHQAGRVTEALEDLRARGFIYVGAEEKEAEAGALWFRSTDFGDDKDRVVVKKTGETTYFLADTAYHRDKHERGFARAIDLFGPDHHGAVPRLKAAMKALGYPEDWIEVLLVQQVNLMMGGQAVEMSKRAGKLVTLRELVDEVGRDVARFSFLMRSVNTHLDFDLALAREESDKNPVFYVQYAHARACSVERNARENRVDPARADLSLLGQPEEMELIKTLMRLPLAVESAVRAREPQRIPMYLMSVAQSFHPFYHRHRVVDPDNAALSAARLQLVQGVRLVMANGLGLIGVSAPEQM